MNKLPINRHPLTKRQHIIGSDVSDAISRIMTRKSGPPAVLDKNDVANELVLMVHTNAEGIIGPIMPIVRATLMQTFINRLTNTAVFQSGYKRYEETSKRPIVPVSEFFFMHVYEEADIESVLATMSDDEVKSSLPKGPTKMRDPKDKSYTQNEDGGYVIYGKIAGIVIFSKNSNDNLLRAWLTRRASNADGQIKSTVRSLEHARPNTTAVENLKERVASVRPAMQKALPKPRQN